MSIAVNPFFNWYQHLALRWQFVILFALTLAVMLFITWLIERHVPNAREARLTAARIRARDSKRDIGAELLASVKEMKSLERRRQKRTP